MKLLEITNKYKKHFKYLKKSIQGTEIMNRLEYVLNKLRKGERLENQYRDHLLSDSGSFKGQRECHLAGNILLIYILEKEKIILNQIGTHSEIYEQSRKRAKITRR